MKRHNDFEQQVMSVIESYGNVQLTYDKESVVSTEILKQSNDKNKLFTDAGSPYYTKIGNQKRTEFVYYSPINSVDIRVECKSRKKSGLLGEILYELNFVLKIPEKKYCMVFSDTLIDKYFLKQLKITIKEKNLTEKVWFGSLKNFERFLKKNLTQM
ncbi:MAG: hypothetical protein JXA77_11300 [Bacteroidales bacterium]|nr:hypothetical protein [Bacteroidales bacterium]